MAIYFCTLRPNYATRLIRQAKAIHFSRSEGMCLCNFLGHLDKFHTITDSKEISEITSKLSLKDFSGSKRVWNGDLVFFELPDGTYLHLMFYDTYANLSKFSGTTKYGFKFIRNGVEGSYLINKEAVEILQQYLEKAEKIDWLGIKNSEADHTGLDAYSRLKIRAAASRVMKKFARADFEKDGIPPLMHGPSFKDSRGKRLHEKFLKTQSDKKLIPLGKHAVPELVQWLDHDEIYIRFIAKYALEKITGIDNKTHQYPINEEPYSVGWFKEIKEKWLTWYEKNKDK